MASEAPEPSKAAKSFVFLCHTPDMTLLEEQLAEARLGVEPGSPRTSVARGLPSCAWALAGIDSQAGAKGLSQRCHESGA
jgi:hypothetical protein